MTTYAPMSINASSRLCSSRRDCWLAAAIVPLLIAPLWITFARQLPNPFGTVVGMVLMLLMVTSTVTVLRQRKVYDWTTYTAVVWGLSLNAFAALAGPLPALGSVGLASSLAGAGICFVIMMAAYELSGSGIGDIKLAVALGTLLGPENGLTVVAYTYAVAAAWMVIWMAWRNGPLTLVAAFFRRIGSWLFPSRVQAPDVCQLNMWDRPIPLAGFFALGTMLVVLERF